MKRKNNRRFLALVMALVLALCINVSALAAPPETIGGEAAESFQAVSEIENDSSLQESDSADAAIDLNEENNSPPATPRNSNAPFFTGAGIALIAFAAVAVFCRIKGNK